MSERRVDPYPHRPMKRERLVTETYEYRMPFNYENIEVKRRYFRGNEFHGVEMNPVNSVGEKDEHLPLDTIEVREDRPIVRVVVMGSACVPPGFIQLEAEPLPGFYSDVAVLGTEAVRFRINNLWGMHMRNDTWLSQCEGDIHDRDGRTYPQQSEARRAYKPHLSDYKIKSHYRENPLTGMSSAIFEIPKSSKVIISGGSECCAWTEDNFPDDVHYSFRMIRVTVLGETK